jgi:putative molybdopterin biosynthesis protein
MTSDPAEAALARWWHACHELGCPLEPRSVTVSVPDVVGRVTTADLHALIASPAAELAAMDGIAVRAADTTAATEAAPVRLTATGFAEIDTGDPLPGGYDAVVMREHVRREPDGSAVLHAAVAPGRHVRRIGEDVAFGELLVTTGHRLRPVDAAVLATAGHVGIEVAARPVVVVVPTGDEVRPIGSRPGRGEVLDTNSLMLAGLARELGCDVVVTPIVPDEPTELAAAIAAAGDRADLVAVLAGSSKGRDDHTATVLAGLGCVVVHGVAIRPAHPTVLAVLDRPDRAVPVIGVPGYPVSAAQAFEAFVRPTLLRLLGATAPEPDVVAAQLAVGITSPAGVAESLLVRLEPTVDGGLQAHPSGRGAGSLSRLMRADGVVRIPAGVTVCAAGQSVLVERLAGPPRAEPGSPLPASPGWPPAVAPVAKARPGR